MLLTEISSLENFTFALLQRKFKQGAIIDTDFIAQGATNKHVDGYIIDIRTLPSNPDFVILETAEDVGDNSANTKIHTMTAGFINKFLELAPGDKPKTFTLRRTGLDEEEEPKKPDDANLPLMLRILNNQVGKGKKVFLDATWRDRSGNFRIFKGIYKKATFKDNFMGLKNAVRIMYTPTDDAPDNHLFVMGKTYTDVADGFEEAHEVIHHDDGSMTLRNVSRA